jgi:hypothetical protein
MTTTNLKVNQRPIHSKTQTKLIQATLNSLMNEVIVKSQNTDLPSKRLSIFIKETFSD